MGGVNAELKELHEWWQQWGLQSRLQGICYEGAAVRQSHASPSKRGFCCSSSAIQLHCTEC